MSTEKKSRENTFSFNIFDLTERPLEDLYRLSIHCVISHFSLNQCSR